MKPALWAWVSPAEAKTAPNHHDAIIIASKPKISIISIMEIQSIRTKEKPKSAQELLETLASDTGDLGKRARQLAEFFAKNPGETALLTCSELAKKCGVHASSVVRTAQSLGFSGYREMQLFLRKDLSQSVIDLKTFPKNEKSNLGTGTTLHIQLLGESGQSFNEAAQAAARRYCDTFNDVEIKSDFHLPHEVEPQNFADQIKAAAKESDGLILVAREHPAINSAVRSIVANGTPVVCITSDLPSSNRSAYVGSDQFASGATAGHLCGRMLPDKKSGKVLFVYSVPFRCQLDREQGFRQVLRTEFPALVIEEKLGSNESIQIIYDAIRRYIKKFGPPTTIYNVSGANIGIGQALEDEGIASNTIFIGHELNEHSRNLLERGTMDVAIGHDFNLEISLSVDCIRKVLNGQQPVSQLTQSQLFTRYNCAIL